MARKIVLAGGSGFIGNKLQDFFQEKGYELVILTREKSHTENGVKNIQWDGKTLGDWTKTLENAVAVINLSGKNVNCRHNTENKKQILESRVDSTHIIDQAIQKCDQPPEVWINASGISIYQDSFDRKMTETDFELGDSFISEVAQKWEAAMNLNDQSMIRKIALRIGVVLGKEGALKILQKQTIWGLGGKHGNGKQMIPWIHIEDIAQIMLFLIHSRELSGAVNACSPNPVTDQIFMRTLRHVQKVPFGLPAPVFAIRLGAKILGTEADLILGSTYAVPNKLITAGYIYKYPELKEALADLK
ncbi:MAG: TIGR01777 family oxidoreductase [Crocinitomicaceae bacterium]